MVSARPAPGVRRRIRTDSGFTMIEVMVATVVFAIVATASLTILINAITIVRQNGQRVQAASIARTEIDRMRVIGAYALTSGVSTKSTSVSGVPYTVRSLTEWVTVEPVNGAPQSTCEIGDVPTDPNRSYARVRVEVTGPALNAPQAVDAIILPLLSDSTADVGAVTVTVVAEDGTTPVSGVTVVMTAANNQRMEFITGSTGCFFARNVPAGTEWTVTVSKPGYVAKLSTGGSSLGSVTAGQTKPFTFTLGRPGSVEYTAGSDAFPFAYGVPFVLGPPAAVDAPASGVPARVVEEDFTIEELFPVPGYASYAGCTTDSLSTGGAVSYAVPSAGLKEVTLGGASVEIIGPSETTVTLRHSADPLSANCTTALALPFEDKTSENGRLRVTIPFGTWTLTAPGVVNRPLVLAKTVSTCSAVPC